MKFIAQVTSGGDAKDDELHTFNETPPKLPSSLKNGMKYNRT
jgi:hypothetical protein